jgi:hypothetical protein
VVLRLSCMSSQADHVVALARSISGKRLDIMDIAVRPSIGVLDLKVGAVRYRTSETRLYLGHSGGQSFRGHFRFSPDHD